MTQIRIKAKHLKAGDTIVTPTGNGTVGHNKLMTYEIPARTVESNILDINMSVGIDGANGKLVQTVTCFSDDYVTVIREPSAISSFFTVLRGLLPIRKSKATSTDIAPLTIELK